VILIVVFAIVGKACYFIIPVPALCLLICPFIFCCNLITIPPGYALVLTYYGKYMGTCKKPGYYWIKPCSDKSLISLKSEQFNGNMLKVNDKDGTPVSIGVVSVYHINDTVKATYGVKDSHSFMQAQTESAIRFIANKFKYDSNEENEPTLKSGNEEINELLKLELQRRTKIAGIEIEDARITEISYGNEIASLMLQKQAADAIINSKEKIAKGAVDIIDKSIQELEKRNVCRFNDEEKSRLVGNMMIVLNMDKGGNAIINCK
jgi:regulator of protease activity HflC (stomatin/prohibitin superfamily)